MAELLTWSKVGETHVVMRDGQRVGLMSPVGSRWMWDAAGVTGLDDETTARRQVEQLLGLTPASEPAQATVDFVAVVGSPTPTSEPLAPVTSSVPWRALQRLERERAGVLDVVVDADAAVVPEPAPAPAPEPPARPGEVRRWNITPSAYQAERDHVRRTHLELLRESPALYHHHVVQGHPIPETKELRIGRALHIAVLQPELTSRLLVEVNRRTNAGKEALLELPADAVALNAGELDVVHGMAEALRTDPLAGPLLERAGERELPLRWTDAETDLPCKVMLDAMFFTRDRDRVRVLDLKSTSDPTPHAWARSAATFGYHRQDAMYRGAAAALTGLPVDFLFLVVRSSPPFEVVVYDLDDQAVEIGRQQVRAALRDLARRLENNTWRASWQGERPRPTTISLPPWALKENP